MFVVAFALLCGNAYATESNLNIEGSSNTANTTGANGGKIAQSLSKISLSPQIHGVIRTRWESEFGDNDFAQRFEVRNARINVGGNLLPQLAYFIQFDASDQGKMVFLDAWGRWEFAKGWRVQAGQFRVPYGVDCFRAPGNYYFANRSFIGKTLLNMREVGVKVGYYGSGKLPLTVEGGVFNSADKSNHNVWQDQLNYAVKASYTLWQFTLTPSFISYQPEAVRINMVGAALGWKYSRWFLEGEVMNKHYTHHAHADAKGWNIFAVYTMPLRHQVFNSLQFQARFDGMTAHSSGKMNSDGQLFTDTSARRRITAGVSIAHIDGPMKALVRIDYEKYFYNKGVTAPRGADDKMLAELVLKF